MRQSDDEAPSSLRGRLADVFFPALVGESVPPLVKRLGELATIDEPIFGSSSGPELQDHVARLAQWLRERGAKFTPMDSIVGAERDVAEGVLDLEGPKLALPVAVVAQRGKSRAIELRLYHATKPLGLVRRGPAPAIEQDGAIPTIGKDVIDALRTHDVYAISTALEIGGVLIDALGKETPRDELGPVISSASFAFEPRASADDLRRCAVECVRSSGRSSLIVILRGDSGLARSVRIYDDD